MMFMPTASQDSEFLFGENSGELYDWLTANDEWAEINGDWHDIQNLPRCEGEKMRQTAEMAEDPTEKTGMVGDFCRAYTIEEAIEAFELPYIPSGDENRYTYAEGTTSNGAEVYDGGLFLYSHHGSDPAADMLVNAFDLVRIHKFGHADEDIDDEVPASKRPSWKAMAELLKGDKKYIRQVAASNYDQLAMFDDIEFDIEPDEDEGTTSHYLNGTDVLDPEIDALIGSPLIKLPKKLRGPKKDDDWFSKLEYNPRDGKIIPTVANIASIVQNDGRLRGVFEYNEFTRRVVTRRQLNSKLPQVPPIEIKNPAAGDPLEDINYIAVRVILEAANGKGRVGYGLKVTDRDLYGAVSLAAQYYPFHPVQDALTSVEWDGIERLDKVFIDYLGCPDDEYHREIARHWFTAAVTRVFEPGHKFDNAVILEGAQGARKSSFIRVLSMGWFGELKADFHDEKRLVEQMQNCFVMELPELSNFNRSSVEDMKAFIAAEENFVRLSYGREPTLFKRQCVFMGSTNKDTYLLDDTGNRRFWPVKVEVGQIDTDRLRREIAQIWAEAVHNYRRLRAEQPSGPLPFFLHSDEAQEIALEAQESRRQHTDADVYAERLAEWLDEPYTPDPMEPDVVEIRDNLTPSDIWQMGLQMPGLPSRSHQMEIAKAMKMLGWEAKRIFLKSSNKQVRCYGRPFPDAPDLL